MLRRGSTFLLDDPAPDALQAGRVVAAVVLPDLPRDRLGPSRVGCFRQVAAEVFDLVDRRQRRWLVAEQPLVVRVFPTRVVLVAGSRTQWSLIPSQTSITYSCKSSNPPGKSRWIIGSAEGSRTVRIIVASLLGGSPGLSYCVFKSQPCWYNSTSRVLPGLGNAFTFSGQYGDSVHVGSCHGERIGKSVNEC